MGRFTDSLLGRLRKPTKPAPDAKGSDLAKVHATAMKRWARADEADRENRERAYEDLEFLEPGGQWETQIRQLRESAGRPCLEFDRLGTTVAQITGDIRQMRPAIKVVAIDDRGDKDTAEVIAGIIRYVENRSDAAAIYFAAADQQVPSGVGHWKVITEYGDDRHADRRDAAERASGDRGTGAGRRERKGAPVQARYCQHGGQPLSQWGYGGGCGRLAGRLDPAERGWRWQLHRCLHGFGIRWNNLAPA
ncbi:hypothetical protein H0176_19920 [Methylorubrum populi]|jgi:hypothetical protein|uniref:Portal protein n=1 Tax=Methylorubrum rhodesianum TaxID=29427 RepID=A0ABU9ZJX5_9HYPH|nr:portal protein [Methylorubrum rhodesianum]MBK3401276.1 hypothetical protein [Methylorubrum rhodesianum]MBY0142528.1 hypothetical protein [Methylorubrum populi]